MSHSPIQAIEDIALFFHARIASFGVDWDDAYIRVRPERFMRACEMDVPRHNPTRSDGEEARAFCVPVTAALKAVLNLAAADVFGATSKPYSDFFVEISDLGEVLLRCETDRSAIRLGQLDHRQRARVLALLDSDPLACDLNEAARIELSRFESIDRFIRMPAGIHHDGQIRGALKRAGGRHVRRGSDEMFEFSGGISGARVIEALVSSGVDRAMPSQAMDVLLGELMGDIDQADVLLYGGLDDRLAMAISRLSPASMTLVEPDAQSANALIRQGFRPIEKDITEIGLRALKRFDVIIGIPPFGKTRDLEAVTSLMRFLKPGGVLCAITTAGWQYGADPVRMRFREQFSTLGMKTFPHYPEDAFCSLGIVTPTVMIRHDEPACRPRSRNKIV